jgi:tRNA(Ile)-lysidine synthetase-like protein
MRKENICAEEDLLKIQRRAKEEWSRMEKKVEEEAAQVIKMTPGGNVILDLNRPLSYPTYVIYEFACRVFDRPTRVHVDALINLTTKPSGKRVLLPGKTEVWKTAGALLAVKQDNRKDESTVWHCIPELKILIGNLVAGSEFLDKIPDVFPSPTAQEAVFDADAVGEEWDFRLWKNGDVFHPFGMSGKKKISDFFCGEKVPVPMRKNTLVLETEKGIAWVVGLRIGNEFKVSSDTKKMIRIYFLNVEKRSLEEYGWQAGQI